MSKKKVLIIDDDKAYLEHLVSLLNNFNAEIYSFSNAEKAAGKAREHQPDLILLDNILPKLNGIEVAELFKELSPKSKILLMSSSFKLEDVAIAYQKGCDYILEKEELNQETFLQIFEANKKAQGEGSLFRELMDRYFKPKKDRFNIAIVEDDNMFSFRTRWLIENEQLNQNIINEYEDKQAFLISLITNAPDIVFLDYYLKEDDSMEIIKHLKKNNPKTKIIVVSSQNDPSIALEIKKNNCFGYVSKYNDWEDSMKMYIEKLEI